MYNMKEIKLSSVKDMANAYLEYIKMDYKYNTLKQYPKIGLKFIEMGKEKGVEIELEYGMKDNVAGFFISAPKFDKSIFKQDIWLEDESEENYNNAIQYFENALKHLE